MILLTVATSFQALKIGILQDRCLDGMPSSSGGVLELTYQRSQRFIPLAHISSQAFGITMLPVIALIAHLDLEPARFGEGIEHLDHQQMAAQEILHAAAGW